MKPAVWISLGRRGPGGSALGAGLLSAVWTTRCYQGRTHYGNDRVRESFLIFGSPVIGEEEIAEVVDSMRSGWVGTGPKVQLFEQRLAEYIGVPYCRCVSSCTAALILSLQVLGIGPGDEVLVPAMTFVASANAVEHAGATPVLVDCLADTGLIDLDAAEAAITPHTKAIMPVHLAGRPVDMDALAALR